MKCSRRTGGPSGRRHAAARPERSFVQKLPRLISMTMYISQASACLVLIVLAFMRTAKELGGDAMAIWIVLSLTWCAADGLRRANRILDEGA